MSLDSMITDSVYQTDVAEDAVYIDASGESIAVRVIPEYDPTVMLAAAEIGVRGVRQAFSLRKSSLAFRPRKGDHIDHGGARYCLLADANHFSAAEWLIYVGA